MFITESYNSFDNSSKQAMPLFVNALFYDNNNNLDWHFKYNVLNISFLFRVFSWFMILPTARALKI